MSGNSAASIVRSARSAAGLSQRALGLRAGMPQSAVSAYERGRKEPSLSVLSRLVTAAGFTLTMQLGPAASTVLPVFSGPAGREVQRHRDELRNLLTAQRFGRPEVFGSIARGDDGPDSDVDVLVDIPDNVGLFALAALQRAAEDLVGIPVDLVPRDGLKPAIASRIARDLVSL